MDKELFGKTKDGIEIYKYTLSNENAMKASFLNYGAVLQSLYVSDKEGGYIDVVLGFDNLQSYENNACFIGAFVGPNANRIGNARYKIDDTEYKLDANDGKNNLHSHMTKGYHNRIFTEISFDEMIAILKRIGYDSDKVKADEEHLKDDIGEFVIFYLRDEEDFGFPGNKDVFVIYKLNERNELIMEFKIISDKKTVINPTHHAYFNLDGHNGGDILGHHLRVYSQKITKIDEDLIPTGEIVDISETALDFSGRKAIGKDLKFLEENKNIYELDEAQRQILIANGYDHNYIIAISDDEVRRAEQMFYYNFTNTIKKKEEFILNKAVELASTNWKVRMMVLTDRPCMQLYSGNFLDGLKGKESSIYDKRSGICLECQGYPDSPNHEEFPESIVDAGEVFNATAVYRFL